jgi:hypothetical protein
MKKFFKMFGAVGLLAGMLMVTGCGSDSSTPLTTTTSTTTIPVASVKAGAAAGTVTTTATVPVAATPITVDGVTQAQAKVTIANGATIIPPTGVSFSAAAPPTIVITQPVNGTTLGVIPALVKGAYFAVTGSAGSVDVSIAGVSSFSLTGAGIDVEIPVTFKPAIVAGKVEVVFIKLDGRSGIVPQGGTYTATAGTTGPGVVKVTDIRDFCWLTVNPTFTAITTTTGSTGGSASVIGLK